MSGHDLNAPRRLVPLAFALALGLIPITMTQTSNQEFLRDFENMVMQAVVAPIHVGPTN